MSENTQTVLAVLAALAGVVLALYMVLDAIVGSADDKGRGDCGGPKGCGKCGKGKRG